MGLEHITQDIWLGLVEDSQGVVWDNDRRTVWELRILAERLDIKDLKSMVIERQGEANRLVGAIAHVRDEDGQIVVKNNDVVLEYVGDVEAMEKFLGPLPEPEPNEGVEIDDEGNQWRV